jgi:CubicO group peptidase (beta-lactamase class C family)
MGGCRSGTEPIHKPGSKYFYSGGGYTVAEHMLELHSGRSARNFLKHEILVPYGMARSTFDTANDDMTNLARGCSRSPCPSGVNRTIAKFAGGILALPADYGRLLALVLNDGKEPNGRKVIPLEDLRQVMTPAWHHTSSLDLCGADDTNCSGWEKCLVGKCRLPIKEDGAEWYGLGVSLSKELHEGYPQALWHRADQHGFSSRFWLDRKLGIGVVIFVNGLEKWTSDSVDYGGGALASDILSAFKRHYR